MTTFLLATASVHTTAAACDYLGTRIDADDTVMVLGVDDPGTDDRDLGDASNVARARLAPATVWTERREGDPSTEIMAVAADIEADEIVLGRRRGTPAQQGKPGLGTTAANVAAEADRPVVVLPVGE
jgi:nucleotide-binding universal stress UspA family protein